MLSISFIVRDSVVNETRLLGEIVSFRVTERRPGQDHASHVFAHRVPPAVTTRVLTYMRFDINRDGRLDIADIGDIIYYLYLRQEGSAAWIEWEGWKFDTNGDGVIDITDLLYIISYF